MLTLQQIFDKSLFGVRLQGKPSLIKGCCMFRANSNGELLKCGVGHLIEDSEYLDQFDNGGCSSTSYLLRDSEAFKNALVNSGIDINDINTRNLLHNLQVAHDGVSDFYPVFIDNFNIKMKKVANTFNLDYN